jgi:hypothetical protein
LKNRRPLVDRQLGVVRNLFQLFAGLRAHLVLDFADDLLGLVVAAVDEEPAGALGDVRADDQDADAEHGADQEGEPPAEVRREDRGVEQRHREQRADRGADPVGAVDHQVDAAAHPGRDQLVDRRVDRRVLAADPHPGEEAASEEVPGGPGEAGGDGGEDVEAEGDEEELLAAEAVGELAEEEGADAGAGDIAGGGAADLGGVEGDPRPAFGEPVADRADDRHLEPVEDPDGTEADDHNPVPARPRQAVEPRRDLGLDLVAFGRGGRCGRHPGDCIPRCGLINQWRG